MARRAKYRSNAGVAMAADGNYTIKCGQNDEIDWQGGNGCLFVEGTWGSGTAKLQIQSPGGTWMDVGISLTADGLGAFVAPAAALRLNLAGSTAASLQASVVGIPTNNGG